MSWNREYVPRRFTRVRILPRTNPLSLPNYDLYGPRVATPIQTEVWKSSSANKKIWIYCIITLVYLLLITAIILVVVLTPRYRQLNSKVDKNLNFHGSVYSLDPRSGLKNSDDDFEDSTTSELSSALTTTGTTTKMTMTVRPKVYRRNRNETTKFKFMFHENN